MQQEMHHHKGVETGRNVVEHDSGAFGKRFQLAHRRWLDDIETSEKYKTREKSFPLKGDGDQGDQLSGDFVDYDKLWILQAGGAGDLRGCGDANQGDEQSQRDCCGRADGWGQGVGQRGP